MYDNVLNMNLGTVHNYHCSEEGHKKKLNLLFSILNFVAAHDNETQYILDNAESFSLIFVKIYVNYTYFLIKPLKVLSDIMSFHFLDISLF